MKCLSRPQSRSSVWKLPGHLASFQCRWQWPFGRGRGPGVMFLWPHAHSRCSPNPPAACVCDSGDMAPAMLDRQGSCPSLQGTCELLSSVSLDCVSAGEGHPAGSDQGETRKLRRSSSILGGRGVSLSRCRVIPGTPILFLSKCERCGPHFLTDILAGQQAPLVKNLEVCILKVIFGHYY